MFAACWSVKGGSGTTVVAASLALVLARRRDQPDAVAPGALLVDLAGDAPAALGIAEPDSPGVAGWLAAGPTVPSDALARIAMPVSEGLALLPRGSGALGPLERVEALAAVLAAERRSVVVDVGIPGWNQPGADPAPSVLAGAATTSLLVTRACYLALRRVSVAPLRPSGVVLVVEPGRALSRRDVEAVVGVPVVAEVVVDEAVARAVDAGLLNARLPHALARALGRAA